MVHFLSKHCMKILVNGYRAKKNKKIFYGGTRNFSPLMTREFNRLSHQVISLNIHGKKQIDTKFSLKKEAGGKNPAWFLKLRLNLTDIYSAKKGVIPNSLQGPLEIITGVIKELKPDIVLLNGFSIINWFILRAAKNAGIPVVVGHHGLWFKEFNNILNKMSPATEAILRDMEKDATRLADRQVFLNEFSRDEFAKNLIKPRLGRSVIIPLPYNPVFQKRSKTILPQKFFNTDKIKLGTVSRWDPVKGPEKFLQTALVAKKLKMPFEFYAVIKLKYKHERIERFKTAFAKNVNVIPQLPQEELPAFYSQMDLMILPSAFDVSPTVVMEAALQGRMTVISPNVGWVSEYRKLGLGEWIVDFSKPKQAIEKVVALINKNNQAVAKFVRSIKTKHDAKRVFGEYDKLFRRLIK